MNISNVLTVVTKRAEETKKLGEKIGKQLTSKKVICLIGELGAGKTCLAQGIAQGLDVKRWVTSPTFIIINEYKGRLPVYHFDLYRLKKWEEINDLGYEEYFYGEGVAIIEWAEKIKPLWPTNHLKIQLTMIDETTRKIVVSGLDNL